MKIKSLLIVFILTILTIQVNAQTLMPMPNHGSVYTAAQTRGFYFTAPVDFKLISVKAPSVLGSANQYIQIMKFASLPPAYAATITPTNLAYLANYTGGTPAVVNLDIKQGDIIGIFATVISGSNLSQSYATPAGPFNSSILGTPVVISRLLYQSTIIGGPATAVSSENTGPLGRVDVVVGPPSSGGPGGNPYLFPPIGN
ncbi:MAG: hypothetical protein H3C45_07055, partial [Bacteroidia bacterium]|nr:hypothetical protein [Bacteroidia bacterium]